MSRAALAATSASTQAVWPPWAARISAVHPCKVRAQVTQTPPSLASHLVPHAPLAYSFSVIITLTALITYTNPINLKTWITLIIQDTLAVLLSQITIKTPQNLTDKAHNPSISKPKKHLITTRSHDHTGSKSAKLIKDKCSHTIESNTSDNHTTISKRPTKIITTQTQITHRNKITLKSVVKLKR